MSEFDGQRRVWLDPLGFTREEAEAVVGTQLRELVKNMKGIWVPGREGEVVASEQIPRYDGNKYQYFVSVVFADRDGNRSLPRVYSKEQLKNFTTPREKPVAESSSNEERRTSQQRRLHSIQRQQVNGRSSARQPNGRSW